LAKSFGSIERLQAATADELADVNDIGGSISGSVLRYFADSDNCLLVERLQETGLQFAVDPAQFENASDTLKGKTIVISGTFEHHSRDEYKELIELHGGKNTGSISKNTDFILAGQNMGPAKLEKATKLGVEILNEEAFLKMIEY